eukprot:scaffold251432_cov34-Prasinocladus_malaysianus.AAC.1
MKIRPNRRQPDARVKSVLASSRVATIASYKLVATRHHLCRFQQSSKLFREHWGLVSWLVQGIRHPASGAVEVGD